MQEVDQQAIEEALGIELGKDDEDEDDEQEGVNCSSMTDEARSCHAVPCRGADFPMHNCR